MNREEITALIDERIAQSLCECKGCTDFRLSRKRRLVAESRTEDLKYWREFFLAASPEERVIMLRDFDAEPIKRKLLPAHFNVDRATFLANGGEWLLECTRGLDDKAIDLLLYDAQSADRRWVRACLAPLVPYVRLTVSGRGAQLNWQELTPEQYARAVDAGIPEAVEIGHKNYSLSTIALHTGQIWTRQRFATLIELHPTFARWVSGLTVKATDLPEAECRSYMAKAA